MGWIRAYRSGMWGEDAKKGKTQQKKTLTFERKNKKPNHQGEARPGWGRAPRCSRCPRMAWGPPAAVPVGKCSFPSLSALPAGAGSEAGRAGLKGPHSSLQYTHTVQYHSNDVRPSVRRRGRSDTPARRSRTPVGYRGNAGRGWRARAPPSKPCWWGTTACRGTAGSARSGT